MIHLFALSLMGNIILAALAILLNQRRKQYKQGMIMREYEYSFSFPSAMPRITLDDLDPIFEVNEFGPTLKTSVHFVGRGNLLVEGGTSDSEAWILSVLAKKALNMFEFGTCTGKTTYLWAVNSPPEAKITTITLHPNDIKSRYTKDIRDDDQLTSMALKESSFEHFMYEGQPESYKVKQLFGDSKMFDETPYIESMDLIFIDGSHAYSYVKSDTEKALKMLKKRGLILWHDYRGPYLCQDVYQYLNDIAQSLPLYHIAKTSMVAYRKAC